MIDQQHGNLETCEAKPENFTTQIDPLRVHEDLISEQQPSFIKPGTPLSMASPVCLKRKREPSPTPESSKRVKDIDRNGVPESGHRSRPPRLTLPFDRLQEPVTLKDLTELLQFAALGKTGGLKQPSWCHLHHQRKVSGVSVEEMIKKHFPVHGMPGSEGFLKKVLPRDAVLVGHSLDNDLRALNIVELYCEELWGGSPAMYQPPVNRSTSTHKHNNNRFAEALKSSGQSALFIGK
ncbi:unnamed protein product, partial [Coregonus sp. 'balchen']